MNTPMPVPTVALPIVRPDSCGKCKFSTSVPGQRNLQCRRHPPTVAHFLVGQEIKSAPVFPPVQTDFWCGEFVLKLAGLNS